MGRKEKRFLVSLCSFAVTQRCGETVLGIIHVRLTLFPPVRLVGACLLLRWNRLDLRRQGGVLDGAETEKTDAGGRAAIIAGRGLGCGGGMEGW